MNPYEVPHETALREVNGGAGLKVKLYTRDDDLEFGDTRHLNRLMHVLLKDIGQEVENIDFIFLQIK